METIVKTYTVLSIEAWSDGNGGWDWNAWYKVGSIECDIDDTDSVSSALIAGGYIDATAWAENGDIEDDQFNIVIVDKKTREPLYAVVYGDQA